MKPIFKSILPLGILLVGMLSACQPFDGKNLLPYEPKNGIYYWRTTFCPTEEERAFVRNHDIGRIYLHMYDVVACDYEGKRIEPIATLQFQDSLMSGVEYVPTVYITQDAIRALDGREAEIAEKIVTRTLNMEDWHEIPNVQEMQIDGDWQTSTRDSYFLFCKELRKRLHAHGLRLSATIRISQLREKVPPVDRGVLMIYNTGRVRYESTENSILDVEKSKEYFGHRSIQKYDLPFDYALPTFGWAAVYNEHGHFQNLSYTMDYPAPQFERLDSTHYRSCLFGIHKGVHFGHGDIIRVETTSAAMLKEVKALLPMDEQQSIILYHLDNNQTSRYTHEEIDSIFAH